MRKQFSTKQMVMAGTLGLLMAAGSQAIVKEAGRETGEVIQPHLIRAGEPFTFAVSGSVMGEVIELKTETGDVVHRAKADKLGRVFLPAGLAAGSYMIAAAQHGSPQKMTIAPASSEPNTAGSLLIDKVPEAINLSEPLRLTGAGFSPNAADMAVNNALALASTSREVVTAPNIQAPGMTEFTVRNSATGETARSSPTLAYDLQGHLEQRTLMTGQQTALRLNFEPKNLPANVRTAVVEGPVNFGQAGKETTVTLTNGVGYVPVHADVGTSGPFILNWSLAGLLRNTIALPSTPRQWLQKKADDCAAASALSENSQNKKALSNEAALDDKLAKDGKNWNKDGTPKSLEKFSNFLNDEIARLEKIARKEGKGAAAQKIADAIGSAYSAGTAAGLNLKGKGK